MSKKKEVFEIGDSEKIHVGLSWDMFEEETAVDLDASCVVFNSFGHIVDAVFYNQLKIDNVEHSGDNLDGTGGDGFDETITIDFKGLDPNIAAFVIVLNCFKGGSFSHVETATAAILDDKKKELSKIQLGCHGKNTALIYCVIYKEFGQKSSWKIRTVGRKANGKHFKDVEKEMKEELEFLIPKEIQQEVAYDSTSLKKFNLSKGQVIRLTGCGKIAFGLGWDTKCDLDASIICFGEDGNCFKDDIVYYSHLKNFNKSIVHQGDNLTGEGEGDDEVINVNLNKLPSNVTAMVCVVTVYSSGKYFTHVKGAYCRLVDEGSKKEVCRYNLSDEVGEKEAMVMCCVFCDSHKVWRMKAIGNGSVGRNPTTWKLIKDAAITLPSVSLLPKVAKQIEELRDLDGSVSNCSIPKLIEKQKKVLEIKSSAKNCDKLDFFGKSDPYYVLSQIKHDGSLNELYKSEVVKNTLNPTWYPTSIDFIGRGARLKVVVYDWNKRSADDYMGEFEFTTKDVLGDGKKGVAKFDIINPKKKKKKKKYKNSGVLEFKMNHGMRTLKSIPNPAFSKFESKISKAKRKLLDEMDFKWA